MDENVRSGLISKAAHYRIAGERDYIENIDYAPWMDEYIDDEDDESGVRVVDEILHEIFIAAHTPTCSYCDQICGDCGEPSAEDIGEALWRLNKYVKCIRDALRQECPSKLVEPLKDARNCIYEAKNAVLECIRSEAIGCNYITDEYYFRGGDDWECADGKTYLLLFRIGNHTFHASANDATWITDDAINELMDTATPLSGEIPAAAIGAEEYEAAVTVIAGLLRDNGYCHIKLPNYIQLTT